MILAGRTQNTGPDAFGIGIFTAESDAAAEEVVYNDPAVQRGVMQAHLFPYRVAVIAEANVRD